MSDPAILPAGARPFVVFGQLLRLHGFAVAPEQTEMFLSAVTLLGPRGMADIRRAALATLAPPPERLPEFDALFRAHFLAEVGLAGEEEAASDEDTRVQDSEDGSFEPPVADEINEGGQRSVGTETLSLRRLAAGAPEEALRRLRREAPARLPRRRGYRRRASNHGQAFDLRRSLRAAIRNDGEIMNLARQRRASRQRNLLLLVDVSGSMKHRTEAHLALAHVLARTVERIEIFTFSTRLTRITRALKLRNREQALDAASLLVADWDGGTRIGDALQAFLAVPRFAGHARGAVVLVLSDGLERGTPDAMVDAVRRLERRAFSLSWLTPLAAEPGYRPETEALKAILPYLDGLADGGSVPAIVRHVLELSTGRAA